MTMQDGMFYRIGDFAYARNARQAVGFYLFHLLIGCIGFMLAVAVYVMIFGVGEGDAPLLMLSKVATAISMLYVAFLSYRLLEAKGRLKEPKYCFYALIGLVVSMGGMLLGLIGVACLSILRPAAVGSGRDLSFNEEE